MARKKTTNPSTALIPAERIERSILLIRGKKVLLDRDLADLYQVETRVLIQAVKRNSRRNGGSDSARRGSLTIADERAVTVSGRVSPIAGGHTLSSGPTQHKWILSDTHIIITISTIGSGLPMVDGQQPTASEGP
jgi:ORF6N domain